MQNSYTVPIPPKVLLAVVAEEAPMAEVGVLKEKLPGAAGCAPNAENPVDGALGAEVVIPANIS